MNIRSLAAGEASAFVGLIRSGLGKSASSQTIYGTTGIAKYIEASNALPPSLSPMMYVVAEDHGRLFGAAEMMVGTNELFLNYITVDTSARGDGIGNLLYMRMIEMCQPVNKSVELRLDVFADNALALGWYQALGFIVERRLDWFDIPVDGGSHLPFPVRGVPQADVCHSQYGFSEFSVLTDSMTYQVGRLGENWYRLTHVAPSMTPRVHSTLALLDKDKARRILLIAEKTSQSPGRLIRQSVRMKSDQQTVLRALRSRSS